MKKLAIEEKARAYDEAIKRAEAVIKVAQNQKEVYDCIITIFPEFKESEDEKIRKAIIDYFRWNTDSQLLNEFTNREVFAWLEKQDNTDKTSYEIAEKEKDNYVSGQFLYCKGSFNEFKEGESYWLEYVGNDNYIGGSDNILNQKFHITPRQLYTWLDPRHDPRYCENNNDENNAPTEYGKYVDECLYDAARHFFSEGEDNYSVADLFYAGIRCGQSWFEKQGEQKHKDRYTFKSISRLLDMIEPTDRAKSYCQKLIDSLLQEGYVTDAKIVNDCLKQMNGEKVGMATMDEHKPTAWSEEDESMLECALDMVKWYIGRNETKCRNVSNWLKSLKQRIEE